MQARQINPFSYHTYLGWHKQSNSVDRYSTLNFIITSMALAKRKEPDNIEIKKRNRVSNEI